MMLKRAFEAVAKRRYVVILYKLQKSISQFLLWTSTCYFNHMVLFVFSGVFWSFKHGIPKDIDMNYNYFITKQRKQSKKKKKKKSSYFGYYPFCISREATYKRCHLQRYIQVAGWGEGRKGEAQSLS